MFSREGKYFIAFFIIFSLLIISTSWFGDFNYDKIIPGSSSIDILGGKRFKIEIKEPTFTDGSANFYIVNKGPNVRRAKISFGPLKFAGTDRMKIFINGELLENTTVYGGSKVKSRIFKLNAGKNIIRINFDNCKYGCFEVDEEFIDILGYNNIQERVFFLSKNWINEETHKLIKTPAYLQLFNFNTKNERAKLKFKITPTEKSRGSFSLVVNNKVRDEVKVGDLFEVYQTPSIELTSGENILKLVSNRNTTKFNIKDFQVVKSPNKIGLGKNWYPNENWYHEDTKNYLDFHWMENNATMHLYNGRNETKLESVGMKISTYHEPKTLEVYLNGQKIKEETIEFTVKEGRNEVFLNNIELKPGENIIKLFSRDGCDVPAKLENNEDERCLSFALYDVDIVQGNNTNEGNVNSSTNSYQYYLLLFLTILLIISFLIHSGRLYNINGVDKKIVFSVVAIFLFSFAIRAYKPKTYQLYLDEPWNVEVADNLYVNQTAELCSYEEGGLNCERYFKPAGYSFYLSLLFSIFGSGISLVFWNSVIFGSLTCVLIFLLGYLITGKVNLSILASLLFSIVPIHIFWSTTAESYVISLFFILLSITFLYYYFNKNDWKLLFSSVVTMLYSIPFRPENVLMLGIFPSLILLEKNVDFKSLFKLKNIVLLGLVGFFIAIYSKTFLHSLKYYRSVTRISFLEISNYISLDFELLIFLLVLIIGFTVIWLEERRLFRFLGIWTVFFLPTLIFHTGTDRMLIPLFLTLSFIISTIITLFLRNVRNVKYSKLALIVVLIIILFTGISLPIEYNNLDAKILQTNVISNFEEDLPERCYIITEHPTLFSFGDNRIISTKYALNNSNYIRNLSSRGCVMFFRGIGCELKIKREGWYDNCNTFLNSFNLEKYREYRRDNISYGFYRVKS